MTNMRTIALILALAFLACGHGQDLPGDWYSATLSVDTVHQGGTAEDEKLSLQSDGTYWITGTVQWGPNAKSAIRECTMYVVTRGQWATVAQGDEETLTLQPAVCLATLGCLDPTKTRANAYALPCATATYQYEIHDGRMTLRDASSPQVYLLSRVPQ